MLKLAWKGVLAHKLRLGLTAIAIVLGVAFVSGTFVFTDTLDRAFTGLFDEINSSVDLYVRGETEFTGQVVPIPADVLDDVKAVPGIGNAVGTVQGFAQFIDNDGEPVGGQAPTFGFSWVPGAEDLTVLTIKEGRPPENAGEVMGIIGHRSTGRSAPANGPMSTSSIRRTFTRPISPPGRPGTG